MPGSVGLMVVILLWSVHPRRIGRGRLLGYNAALGRASSQMRKPGLNQPVRQNRHGNPLGLRFVVEPGDQSAVEPGRLMLRGVCHATSPLEVGDNTPVRAYTRRSNREPKRPCQRHITRAGALFQTGSEPIILQAQARQFYIQQFCYHSKSQL